MSVVERRQEINGKWEEQTGDTDEDLDGGVDLQQITALEFNAIAEIATECDTAEEDRPAVEIEKFPARICVNSRVLCRTRCK